MSGLMRARFGSHSDHARVISRLRTNQPPVASASAITATAAAIGTVELVPEPEPSDRGLESSTTISVMPPTLPGQGRGLSS